MKFEITARDSNSPARTGFLETAHGKINTPVFMPVGTQGSVKAVHMRELREDIGAEIILGNTYHLFLRPGTDVIENAGGLHKFNGWDMPMLTDSGGYQVYSLAENRKIKEDGVTFQSHIDGTRYNFTPESVIDVQRQIGADIIMAFDECTPFPCEYDYAKESMDLTHRWLDRCRKRFEETSGLYDYEQVMFPIVQGSTFEDLRKISAEFVAEQDFPGNAIGGLSVGEPPEIMYEITEQMCGILPESKPRYLMGVGTPANILECIAHGIDMFDCVMPTRNGRNGMLFTSKGIVNIKNEKWKNDFSPIDPELEGYSSTFHSKAYLRHLILSKEILGAQIASLHNLTFYMWLVRTAREKIQAGEFASWKNQMVEVLSSRVQ